MCIISMLHLQKNSFDVGISNILNSKQYGAYQSRMFISPGTDFRYIRLGLYHGVTFGPKDREKK